MCHTGPGTITFPDSTVNPSHYQANKERLASKGKGDSWGKILKGEAEILGLVLTVTDLPTDLVSHSEPARTGSLILRILLLFESFDSKC